jgi:hypothetical protein
MTNTTGEMTIPAVSKSDEGLYKCNNPKGESPESWMTVTGEQYSAHTLDLYLKRRIEMCLIVVCGNGHVIHSPVPSSAPGPAPSPAVPVWSISLPRLLCSLLVVSPYLLVTIILVVKCNSRRSMARGENPTTS